MQAGARVLAESASTACRSGGYLRSLQMDWLMQPAQARLTALGLALLPGAFQDPPPADLGPPEALGTWEERLGWRRIFDGATLDGWHAFGRPGTLPDGWTVEEGALHHRAGMRGGDLVSDASFGDFELEFEWRVAPGANSGVKYRFRDDAALGAVLGPEYQILDDAGHADGGRPETSAAALYALVPASKKVPAPAGSWNRARIVSRGEHVEHWLNGARVLAAEIGSADWEARRAASKFAAHPDFGRARPSPIALQDHGDAVWFRELKIRDPEHPPGVRVELFDGRTLAGWRACGGGEFSVDDGSLLVQGGAGKGFLVCERPLTDFVLELELRCEGSGNSGIQLRSHIDEQGLVRGYQIEVDPSERAWSGGLYVEGGEWLQSLEGEEQARAAFRPGEWNSFRLECSGPLIRAQVNGIPTCDFRSAEQGSGVLALQAHDPATRVRWRDFRLWDLGR